MTTPPKHAKLGFSSRHRWSVCPASIALSEGIPNTSSPAAEEGTCAHSVKEWYMRQAAWRAGAQVGDAPEQAVPDGLDLKGRTPAQWNAELRKHALGYATFVGELLASTSAAYMVVEEQRVAATSLHPDLYGTADTLIWQPAIRQLIVIDYKYGYRAVDVGTVDEPNPQLAAYAVAAVEQLGQLPDTIVLAVYQPRVPMRDPVQTLCIGGTP